MPPHVAAWLASLRAELAVPGTLLVIVGRARFFPEDIVGKSDDELLDLIQQRLNEKD